jgi:CubicO group peptidase (beta-lactamase class C family)
MNNTYFSTHAATVSKNYASPYQWQKGGLKKVSYYNNKPAMISAGGITSNVEDMSKWVMFNANNATVAGKQLLSQKNFDRLFQHDILASKSPSELVGDVYYGLGWYITTYRSHRYIYHSGGIDGFASIVTLLPDEHSGVVVLTNSYNSGPPTAYIIAGYIADYLLKAPETDWDKWYSSMTKTSDEAIQNETNDLIAKRVYKEDTPVPTRDYVGNYTNPAYSWLVVMQENDQLIFKYNTHDYVLHPYDKDIFATQLLGSEESVLVNFKRDKNNNVLSVEIPFESTVSAIVFQKES